MMINAYDHTFVLYECSTPLLTVKWPRCRGLCAELYETLKCYTETGPSKKSINRLGMPMGDN